MFDHVRYAGAGFVLQLFERCTHFSGTFSVFVIDSLIVPKKNDDKLIYTFSNHSSINFELSRVFLNFRKIFGNFLKRTESQDLFHWKQYDYKKISNLVASVAIAFELKIYLSKFWPNGGSLVESKKCDLFRWKIFSEWRNMASVWNFYSNVLSFGCTIYCYRMPFGVFLLFVHRNYALITTFGLFYFICVSLTSFDFWPLNLHHFEWPTCFLWIWNFDQHFFACKSQ